MFPIEYYLCNISFHLYIKQLKRIGKICFEKYHLQVCISDQGNELFGVRVTIFLVLGEIDTDSGKIGFSRRFFVLF